MNKVLYKSISVLEESIDVCAIYACLLTNSATKKTSVYKLHINSKTNTASFNCVDCSGGAISTIDLSKFTYSDLFLKAEKYCKHFDHNFMGIFKFDNWEEFADWTLKHWQ